MVLKVQHRPEIINDPKRKYVAAEVGQSARISCRISARPQPTHYRWLHNGQDISNNLSTYDYSVDRNDSFDSYVSMLTIRQVTPSDMG